MKNVGVIVGSNKLIEWMLPWWWYHYILHNDLPIAFMDFGMSKQMIKWCEKRGKVIAIPKNLKVKGKKEVPPSLAKKWTQRTKGNIWAARKQWFKKPLAFALSPFSKTLWLDIDCEVKIDVSEIFDFCTNVEIALAIDAINPKIVVERFKLIYPDEVYYNSGVVVFNKDAKCISSFAKRAYSDNHLFLGDQCLLSRIIYEEKPAVFELPQEYNWPISMKQNSKAKIYHWICAQGKAHIQKEFNTLLSFEPIRQYILS